MAAAWAAVYGIKTKVVDKRATKIENGHADGLQSRTIEILHSFGFGDGIYKEANRLQEVCFWVSMVSPLSQAMEGVEYRNMEKTDAFCKTGGRIQMRTVLSGELIAFLIQFQTSVVSSSRCCTKEELNNTFWTLSNALQTCPFIGSSSP